MGKQSLMAIPIEGDIYELENYRPENHGALYYWNTLVRKYLHTDQNWLDVVQENGRAIDDLIGKKELLDWERILIIMVWDNVMIKREEVDRLIPYLEEYTKSVPESGWMPKLIGDLKKYRNDLKIFAFAFIQTSVCCNEWTAYDEATDTTKEYNRSMQKTFKGGKPFFLFEEFDSIKSTMAQSEQSCENCGQAKKIRDPNKQEFVWCKDQKKKVFKNRHEECWGK